MNVPKHIIYEFVDTMNVYLNVKKLSSSFNYVLYSCDLLLQSIIGMFGNGAKHSLDKTELNYCSYGSLPICKKGSPYLISLKCYLKGLTMSGHNLD